MTKAKTKRVRIAVAVNAKGDFFARGMKDGDTDPAVTLSRWDLDVSGGWLAQIAEIEVQLPEDPAVVQGEVVDG